MEPPSGWGIEFTPGFRMWWAGLGEDQRRVIGRWIDLLRIRGPNLGFPYSSDIRGSSIGGLRELRIRTEGRPYRILYAFDPRRVAVFLTGGDKASSQRWYERQIRIAEARFAHHLRTLGGS